MSDVTVGKAALRPTLTLGAASAAQNVLSQYASQNVAAPRRPGANPDSVMATMIGEAHRTSSALTSLIARLDDLIERAFGPEAAAPNHSDAGACALGGLPELAAALEWHRRLIERIEVATGKLETIA